MLQSLIWDYRGPQSVLCTPKNGRKLLLGKKHIFWGFRAGQEVACGKREFQDLFNLAQFTGCLKNDLFFLQGNSNFLRFKDQYFYRISSLLQAGKQDF